MTREERIAVCYQHACLLYEDGLVINNQIVRERFNLNKNQAVMASRILADTQESGLIKMKDPETESKRYSSYIPVGWRGQEVIGRRCVKGYTYLPEHVEA